MTLCIFCDTELTPATKPEQILLNALGGRKTTRRAICSSHNNKFGATIDKAITDQVAAFRNLLKLDSGPGKPPPPMRIENTGGERLILHADGKPDLVQKPFVFTPRPEGGSDIEINARDEAELTRVIPNVAAALGASESGVWEQLAQNGTGTDAIGAQPAKGRAQTATEGPSAPHLDNEPPAAISAERQTGQ